MKNLKTNVTSEQAEQFWQIANEIVTHENFQKLKNYIAHGKVTVFEHCLNVAKLSFAMATTQNDLDINSIIRGALLHDYYQYDWHKNPPFTFHGFKHPKIALKNAKKDFTLNKKEENIIRSHMFPLTIFHFPKSKEARIVSSCDKKVASFEHKGKKIDFNF